MPLTRMPLDPDALGPRCPCDALDPDALPIGLTPMPFRCPSLIGLTPMPFDALLTPMPFSDALLTPMPFSDALLDALQSV